MVQEAVEKAVFGVPRRVGFATAAVVALALLVRIAFAIAVTSRLDPGTFRNVHGDTNGYARIGENLFHGDKYVTTAAGPGESGEKFRVNVAKNRSRALARPPGYPAYYAALRLAGFDLLNDMRPIVWPQVVASALATGAIFLLAYLTLGHMAAAIIAGVLAIFSPTAIAAASLATPDSLYSACFAGSFACYVALACRASNKRQRIVLASASGALLALAVALKPAAMYWPIAATPALFALRGLTLATLRDVALCFGPMLLVVALWTAANYQREGIVVYSTIATRNLRYDVVPRIELTAELGRSPTRKEYDARATKVIKRDSEGDGDRTPQLANVLALDNADIRETLRAQPWIAAKVMLANLWDQLSTGWLWIDKQLPGEDRAVAAVRGIFHRTCREVPLTLWFTGVVAALPLSLIRRDTRALAPLTLSALALAYVALGNGTVQGEGSRLMLAGEPMAIVLITATICYSGDLARTIANRWRGAIHPSSEHPY